MSKLTFAGWLKIQINHMSDTSTLSLSNLAQIADESQPRLYPFILCYAIETNAVKHLFKCVSDKDILTEYEAVARISNGKSLVALSQTKRKKLPWSYNKLLASWDAAYNMPKTVNDSKKLRWRTSKKLQNDKRISNACVYKALGLNKGNVNAYLKYGDTSKVSLDNATAIMKYLYAA
jgi:hypothetical protein